MNVLQSLVLPNLDVCNEEALYLRPDPHAWCELAAQRVRFAPGGSVSTDTFHNGLTVAAWKRLAPVAALVLALEGEGEFILTVGLHRHGRASVWLAEHAVTLVPGQRVHLPLRAWERIDDGLLFFRLRAVEAGTLTGAAWLTPDAPAREVHLGIVVTHFNRQAQVLPAIERVRRFIEARADLRERVTLTVVDNSSNLPPVGGGPVTLLPNRNLGGTGGFVRGLIALLDGGHATHALFMDDDASCETEAIARTVALLQFAREPRQAVAGALLREMAPWHLIEKGARFDHQVRQLHTGLDLRHVGDLLEAERDTAPPDYGAWWFFAFPLAGLRRLPFPFFVRGDDIEFGLANRFPIATLNGIACLGDDFGWKHSPLTAYLDARYHLVLALAGERAVGSRIFFVASRLFLKPLTSYHWSSARAATLAVRHVTQGPRFFAENVDLQQVRAEIGGWQPSEKLQPLGPLPADLRGARRSRESRGRRLLRLVTLQGFLLPKVLIRDRTTLQDKGFHGSARAVFRYRRALVRHEPSGTGYVVEYDRRRFFAELRGFASAWSALLRRLPELRADYRRGMAELGSLAFWRGVYGAPAALREDGPPASPPQRAASTSPTAR